MARGIGEIDNPVDIGKAYSLSARDMREMRAALGLSQKDLARIMCVRMQTISDWECRRREIRPHIGRLFLMIYESTLQSDMDSEKT